MDANHLSKRLAEVAKYVPKGARLADIGSDHAYLPASLLINHHIQYGIAGEVAKGPYENEIKEINKLQLTDRLVPRLADGLAAIESSDHINTITIAGMGGSLIARILDEGQDKLAGVKRLILQPNVGEARVREWLMAHRYQINAEEIVQEDNHIYEIIMAEPSLCPFRYDQRELLFGPFLLQQRNELFIQKWQAELRRCQNTLRQMKKATTVPKEHLAEVQQRAALIQEVLGDD